MRPPACFEAGGPDGDDPNRNFRDGRGPRCAHMDVWSRSDVGRNEGVVERDGSGIARRVERTRRLGTRPGFASPGPAARPWTEPEVVTKDLRHAGDAELCEVYHAGLNYGRTGKLRPAPSALDICRSWMSPISCHRSHVGPVVRYAHRHDASPSRHFRIRSILAQARRARKLSPRIAPPSTQVSADNWQRAPRSNPGAHWVCGGLRALSGRTGPR